MEFLVFLFCVFLASITQMPEEDDSLYSTHPSALKQQVFKETNQFVDLFRFEGKNASFAF
jgi:hypothetical protein